MVEIFINATLVREVKVFSGIVPAEIKIAGHDGTPFFQFELE
jgi:hypothetical protein